MFEFKFKINATFSVLWECHQTNTLKGYTKVTIEELLKLTVPSSLLPGDISKRALSLTQVPMENLVPQEVQVKTPVSHVFVLIVVQKSCVLKLLWLSPGAPGAKGFHGEIGPKGKRKKKKLCKTLQIRISRSSTAFLGIWLLTQNWFAGDRGTPGLPGTKGDQGERGPRGLTGVY